MKKNALISIALSLVMSASLFATGVAAAMKPVGDKTVNFGTPKIDGTIGADEWKDAAVINFDASTAKPWSGTIPDDFKSVVKVLWDNDGLYMSGTIDDTTYRASSDGAYDGDAFQISIDAGQIFKDAGEKRAIFYSFGCYDSGKAMVQRQESNNNAVMYDGDGVTIKTTKKTGGWSFEVMFPWSTLTEDVKLKSGKDITPAEGLKINMMLCYINRDDAGMVCALGTTLTGEDVAYDWGPADHGITLILAKPVVKEEVKDEAVKTSPATSDYALAAVAAGIISAAAIVLMKRKTK